MYKTEMHGSKAESTGDEVAAESESERVRDATSQPRRAMRFRLKIRTNVKAGGYEWG